jgi:hypothetical protein
MAGSPNFFPTPSLPENAMPTITFTAPASVFDFQQLDPESGEPGRYVEDFSTLKQLDGLTYADEVFSDYLGDGGDTRSLYEAGIEGGRLSFSADPATQRLLAHTEYTAPRHLSESEIDLLKTYTMGQWSDGIGSNFFQERMDQGLAPQIFIMDEAQVLVELRN